MKKAWMVMTIVTGLALVLGACGTAAVQPPAAAQPPAATNAPMIDLPSPEAEASQAEAQDPNSMETSSNLILNAMPVSELPAIDGKSSDEQWKTAPKTQIGGTVWKAVYTDTDLALLIKWMDRSLTMAANGNYSWDPKTNSWSQPYQGGHSDTFNVAWGINTTVAQEGCAALCHEDPPGSGQFHHRTASADESIDSWMFLGKHGWGYWRVPGVGGVQSEAEYGFEKGDEDQGWSFGSVSAQINSPLTCVTTNPDEPCTYLAGDVTFIDYAEDTIIVGANSTIDVNRDRPRDLYCQNCHKQINLPYDPLGMNLTKPDDGATNYAGNWEVPYTVPAYMEINPTDYVDAMVLTQAEVDNGEAVAIKTLTPEQISQYWEKYSAVNGIVPNTLVKLPDKSMADVLTAANWKDGVWTLEITRKLVTPYGGDDVQFDDLAKDYPFTAVMFNGYDLLMGPPVSESGSLLRFNQDGVAQK